jgi:hypothetical protein
MRSSRLLLAFPVAVTLVACASSSSSSSPPPNDAGGAIDLGAPPDFDASVPDDAHGSPIDGDYATGDGGAIRADRFVTKVVSFTPGDCAGFGLTRMPDVVYGPPVGGGDTEGGLDVVSLGNGGEIVLSFEPNAIVDGPGVDFLVFENAFYAGGNPNAIAADPGEVSVSDDGITWKTWPCTATAPPYGACAGWHPVYSAPGNGISPVDPKTAGGDPYDLADLGLSHARFVRIKDKSTQTCPPLPNKVDTNGFDLDAIAIVNAQTP